MQSDSDLRNLGLHGTHLKCYNNDDMTCSLGFKSTPATICPGSGLDFLGRPRITYGNSNLALLSDAEAILRIYSRQAYSLPSSCSFRSSVLQTLNLSRSDGHFSQRWPSTSPRTSRSLAGAVEQDLRRVARHWTVAL